MLILTKSYGKRQKLINFCLDFFSSAANVSNCFLMIYHLIFHIPASILITISKLHPAFSEKPIFSEPGLQKKADSFSEKGLKINSAAFFFRCDFFLIIVWLTLGYGGIKIIGRSEFKKQMVVNSRLTPVVG